ncbi:MAG: hypothetical protein ACU0BK_13865 [Shimia sp.]|uniref:hypothetical protein n=1 Tax=Shimia sp. TaxID=1954381 RepID=UPI0040583BE2
MKIKIRAGIVGLASLGLLIFSGPLKAAGTSEINYRSDGKATAKACLGFLASGQATNALTKSGFEIKRSTKKMTLFKKVEQNGLLPTYFHFAVAKKSGDQDYRRCTFHLSLPKRLAVERSSPEFKEVLNALRTELKTNGYKKSIRKNAVGKETEIWTGPHGSYKFQIASGLGTVSMDVCQPSETARQLSRLDCFALIDLRRQTSAERQTQSVLSPLGRP